MSARKKGRGAKELTVPRHKSQKASSRDKMDSPNLSVIDKASFLEGLQANNGTPLHSTALEEDLNVQEEGQVNKGKAGKKAIPQTTKTTVKQRGPAVKRKETERDREEEEEEEKKKKKRSRIGETVKARPETEGGAKEKKGAPQKKKEDVQRKAPDPSTIPQESNQPAADSVKRLVGKKPAQRRSAGQTSAARPVKNQQMKKDKKRRKESGSGKSSDPQSQEESDAGTAQQRRKEILSSDEEVMDEDKSWNPSPKKAGRSRKASSDRSKSRTSSSGSASAEPGKANKKKHTRKSKAVKQSTECLSSDAKKIAPNKKPKVLKRKNPKVSSLIRKKKLLKKRLLDATNELMREERQASLLKKENAALKLRLDDLKLGQAFLHDIGELNRQYLEYRHKHPKQKEKYGASSLPALKLETKYIR